MGGVRKVVSLKLLRENRITFTSHSIGEEALYSFRILHAAGSISFIEEKPVYYYVIHENSQSGLRIADPWGDVAKCLKEYILEQGMYDKFGDTLNAFGLAALVVSLDRINQMFEGREKKQRAEERMIQFHDFYDKSFGIDYRNMSYKAKVFTPFLLHDIYWPVMLASKLRKRA